MKLNVPIKFLQPANNETKKNQKLLPNNIDRNSHTLKIKAVKSEINVIGLNVEEATFMIDKFLDDALLSRLETIHIVHR